MNITREAVIVALNDCGGSGTVETLYAAFCARYGPADRQRFNCVLRDLADAKRITRTARAFYALPGVTVTPPDTLADRLARFVREAPGPVSSAQLLTVAGVSRTAMDKCIARSPHIRRIAQGWCMDADRPLPDGWQLTQGRIGLPGHRAQKLVVALRAAGRPMTYAELSAVAGYPLSAKRQIPKEVVRVAYGWYALRDFDLTGWRPPANGRARGEREQMLIDAIRAAGRPLRYAELVTVAGRPLGKLPAALVRVGPGWYGLRDVPLGDWQPPVPTPTRPTREHPPRARPLPAPPELGTIAWYIEQFLADIAANRSSSTVLTYKSLLMSHLVSLGLPIERITTDDLRPLLTGKPASRSTRRTIFDVFWKYAVKQGWCAVNPVELLPRIHVNPPDRKPLTDDERAALYAAADDLDREAQGRFSFYRLMLLLLDQGLRRKEAAGIRWCDVRWDEDCINVSVTKGRKRHGPIPLASELRCALEEARPPDDAGTVLGIDCSTIYNTFKRIARRAGVERAFPHLMRHTWATSYLLRGGSAFHLQTLGGWADEKMLRERYGKHALERAALDEARRINGENGNRQKTAPVVDIEIPEWMQSNDDDHGDLAEALRYLADPRIRAALLALGRAMKGGDHASA